MLRIDYNYCSDIFDRLLHQVKLNVNEIMIYQCFNIDLKSLKVFTINLILNNSINKKLSLSIEFEY